MEWLIAAYLPYWFFRRRQRRREERHRLEMMHRFKPDTPCDPCI